MKLKIDRRIEAAFLLIALIGIAGRAWVLPSINWWQQAILFVVTLLLFNGILLFHYWFNNYLNKHLPFEQNMARRITVQLLVGWIVVKIMLLMGGLLIIKQIIPALSESINRLTLITLGLVAFLVNIVISLIFIASYLFKQWEENRLRAARLEKEKSQVQYDNLKNQLNPHFLFNSLSSLDSLIDDNPALARRFLQQLSRVFRYVLQHKDKALVPLETELDFIKNYVSLLQTRFDGTFRLTYQISPDALDRQIVPVTLQILIENAVKHNVISEARPLIVYITADHRSLTVSNHIQRKKQVGTSNGQGLQNLQLLYSYLSTSPVDVRDDGTLFEVKVPLIP
ncbi:sensor histidine kinase [Spirosoma utsteinense]|uniref:Sensor histidine kinase YesM n=1 Tax=Spirosoma utsteinense TaxID=2585773 RepID=A0ABR6VZG3_9BACT|nr:histidine kinase [Spirosoma utsteinense]MBC3784530.1 sensor histidine kinase YesM [Spirosoma utsteinense]MBC3789719.1 sensor histidine kinase YesM [Spirosoma utsteinense]